MAGCQPFAHLGSVHEPFRGFPEEFLFPDIRPADEVSHQELDRLEAVLRQWGQSVQEDVFKAVVEGDRDPPIRAGCDRLGKRRSVRECRLPVVRAKFGELSTEEVLVDVQAFHPDARRARSELVVGQDGAAGFEDRLEIVERGVKAGQRVHRKNSSQMMPSMGSMNGRAKRPM